MRRFEEQARDAVMRYAPFSDRGKIIDVKVSGKVAAVHYRAEGRTDIVYLAWGPTISTLAEITRGANLTLGEIKDDGEHFIVDVNGFHYKRSKISMRLV